MLRMNRKTHLGKVLRIFNILYDPYYHRDERDSQHAAALDAAYILMILPQGEVAKWMLGIHDFHTDSCKVVIYSAEWKSVKNRW